MKKVFVYPFSVIRKDVLLFSYCKSIVYKTSNSFECCLKGGLKRHNGYNSFYFSSIYLMNSEGETPTVPLNTVANLECEENPVSSARKLILYCRYTGLSFIF